MTYYFAKNLKFLRKLKGVNQTQVSDLVGKGNTTIANWEKEVSEPNISEILTLSNFFEVSVDELLNNDLTNTHLLENINSENIDTNAHLNTHPSTHLKSFKHTESHIVNESEVAYGKPNSIPLVGIKAVGGFGNTSFAIEKKDIKDYYSIPKFNHKKVDFMIEVEGASMYPKYNSGDVVACTKINDKSFLQWNKTHVIATKEQGILIKRIKQGSTKDTLLMVSDNSNYDPFEIPKTEIEGLALVVGVIRLE